MQQTNAGPSTPPQTPIKTNLFTPDPNRPWLKFGTIYEPSYTEYPEWVRQTFASKMPGYTPSYWENPRQVARYYNVLQSMPSTWEAPAWLNKDEITAAYDYLKATNQDAPWWEWKYLHPDDPGRAFLQGIQQPPNEMLWPDEGQYALGTTQPTPAIEQIPNPAEAGLTPEQYEALPTWQKWVIPVLNSPLGMGVVQSVPFALPGLLAAPFTGGASLGAAAVPLLMGAALGGIQEPAVTEWLTKNMPAAAGLPKTLADAMYALFGLAPEALERVAGLGAQAYGAAINPEKYGSFAELTQNLPAAWRAAHFALETAPVQAVNILPMISGEQQAKAGEIWGALGQPGMGVPIPAPPMGIEALAAFRRSFAAGEVKTLLDQGQLGLDQINAFLAGQYGFSGQLNELIGQTALFFVAQQGQHRITRFGIEEYARLRDNPELLAAARLGGGRPVETLQAYGTQLMGKPTEELARLGAVERWLTNVSKEGEYLGLQPGRVSITDRLRSGMIIGGLGAMAGFALGGPGGALAGAIMTFPIGFKSQYMAQLRPAAQANEVVNGVSTIAAAVIGNGKDDPRIIDRYVTGLANTPLELSRELSVETIMSPVGSAFPLFMKDVAPQVHDLLASYEASRPQASLVEKIARVLGIKPEEAIQELSTAKDANNLLARVVEKARAMAATDDNAKAIVAAYEDGLSKTPQLPPEAQLTADNLKSVTKMFAGDDAVPLSPTDFKADTWNIIRHGADEWAAKWFNVQPEPVMARLGGTMKAAQSVVLLGLNPTFLINNFLNNFVTMAARGNFGLRTPEQITAYWKRIGIEPARLKAGIGPTALGAEGYKQAIMAATVKPGFLADVDRFLHQTVGKFMLMSNLSMEAEKMASQQAQTHSMMKAMNILHREGVGFDRLPGPLEDMLNTVNPNLSRFVYATIRGSLSQAEIERDLWTDYTRLHLDQGIPRYVEEARRVGVDISETSVRSMLTDTGVFDLLNERLKTADTNEQINSAFNEVDRVANDWLNEQSRGSLQKKAVDVAVKVKTEGFAGVVKLWDEMQLQTAELWHQHFMDWQVAMDQASRLTGEQARAVIIAQRSAARQTWDRAWKSQSAEILGIFEGLGIESQAARDTLSHFIDQADTWKAFYTNRDKLTDRFFNTDYADAATRTAAWRDLSDQMLKMYIDAGVDEVKHQNALDNAFVEQMAAVHGDEVGTRARAWRDRMLNFYKDRAGMMSTHRQSVVDMTPDERRTAWPKFLNDQYMPYLRQFFQEQINGAHELYGFARPPTEPPTPIVPTMPIPPGVAPQTPAPPTAGVAPAAGVAATETVLPIVHPSVGGTPEEIRAREAARYASLQAELKKFQAEPFMITPEMREQLTRQSYSAAEIASMTPREAQANINRGTPNPERVAASFPALEPTPERQNQVAQVRQVASEAGYATSDENGFYVPGADRHILNAIKMYGGPEAAGYESLADVNPEVARQAFKNKDAVLAEFHKVPPSQIARDKLVEMSRTPSEELPDYIKTPLRQIATAMKNDLYGGLVLKGKVTEVTLPDGTREIVPLAGTENMEWYAVLYNSGIKSKGQVEAALNRIIEGTDTANLKGATIIKEMILEWMQGKYPNAYTDPRPGLLLDMGLEQDAVTAYNNLFETGEAANFTDAQWLEYAGNADILARLQDLWGKSIAAQPQPHPTEAAQEGFILGPGRMIVPPETQAIMDAITQREHLLSRLTEIKTTVDNGVTLLSAGDAREMLRDSAVRIFGVTAEEADGIIAITDARAQTWAQQNGRSAAEWYQTRLAGLVKGGLEGKPVTEGWGGAIEFLEDGRAIIRALQAPDVYTLLHETIHIFRRDLEGNDLAIVERWAGVKNGKWEASQEEKFARAGERYFAEGIAPVEGLRAVFENFKRWALRIYTAAISYMIDVKITPELRGVFDRLLSEAPTAPAGQAEMFAPEQVMPLFTGTPMRGQESLFRPTGEVQPIMPGLTEAYVPKFGEGIKARPYEGLIPGTPEWLAFWNAHPELQQEMLRWRSQWFDTDSGPKRLFQGQAQSADGTVEPTPGDAQFPLPGMGAMGAADGLQTQAPIADILDNGYTTRVKPILDGLKRYYLSPDSRLPETIKDLNAALPVDVVRELRSYLGKVYGQMTDTKLAAIRYAEMRRDAALLNYNKRYGFDNVVGFGLPYEFWYTRNALNWALGAIDNPLWMATYANLRRMQRNTIQTAGFPTRLADKMKVSIPFLPEWMGGGIYVDPLRQMFPFEQLARPWEQAQKDTDAITRRAEYNVQQMVHDEEISETDAQAAIQDHAGLIWEKAYAQAKLDTDSDTANPYEFINLMMGWALPIQWAYYGLTGQKDKINALPITRMVNAVTSGLGMNKGRGINLEGPIRRTLGMPELNQYDDYRVDRMLANMAAEGLITADDATRAMLDRTGPAFLQAQQRVAQMGTWSYFGAPAALDFFPEGEATQRALQGEYQKALEAWMKDEKSTAMQDFFDKYPEYEARMALYRDPESRLKQFMISEVWNKYRQLPDLYQKQMRDQLGDQFNDAFINKETRSYESINTQTLSMWAQVMGSILPAAAGTIPEAPVTLASPEVAKAYQDFRDTVNQKWPNVYSALDIYYRIPPGKVQDAYAKKHPEIDAYYKFRNAYFAANPEIIPYATGEESAVAGAKPEIQQLYYVFMSSRDQQFPGVMQLQDQYYNLPAGSQRTAFRKQNPMLANYWDWRREFMRQYPQTIPYLMSVESLAETVLNEQISTPAIGVGTTQAVAAPQELQEFTPALLRALLGYYQADQPLSAGAQKELRRIWTQAGQPAGDLTIWLEQVVKPLFVQ
jgi:hypothetical protein